MGLLGQCDQQPMTHAPTVSRNRDGACQQALSLCVGAPPTSAREGPPVLGLHLAIPYRVLAMYTTQDLQRILGKSRRQVRERVDALAAIPALLDGQVTKGPRGRKEYTVAVLDMLRDLDTMAADPHVTLGQAAGQVAAKIRGNDHGNGSNGDGPADGNRVQGEGQVNGEVAALRELVDHLRRENERLWQLVNEQLPRLPAPPARPWWWPLRRLVFGG